MKDFEKQSNPTIPAEWWKNRLQEKSVEIRLARNDDIPALAQLYSVCFGDDAEEAADFLRLSFSHSGFRLLLAENRTSVLSMLAMIPARLAKRDGGFFRGFYLYGIGTLPSFRRQGLSGALIRHAEILAASLDCAFLFLVPASTDLIAFYEKQGFLTVSPIQTEPSACPFPPFARQKAASAASPDLAAISFREYLALRADMEKLPGVFSLTEPFRTYALEILREHLYFYKERRPVPNAGSAPLQKESGLCFYCEAKADEEHLFENKEGPPLRFLERTGTSLPLSGGLIHQIFPLSDAALPDATYFQFPMDDLSAF